MGIKKKEYTRHLTFRVTDEMYDKIMNQSKAAGLTHGEYLRRQVTKGKVVVRQEIVADVPQLKRVINELNKIGTNINQIARCYNDANGDDTGMTAKLQAAIADIYAMKYEVEQMGGEFRGYSKAHTNKKQ